MENLKQNIYKFYKLLKLNNHEKTKQPKKICKELFYN